MHAHRREVRIVVPRKGSFTRAPGVYLADGIDAPPPPSDRYTTIYRVQRRGESLCNAICTVSVAFFVSMTMMSRGVFLFCVCSKGTMSVPAEYKFYCIFMGT